MHLVFLAMQEAISFMNTHVPRTQTEANEVLLWDAYRKLWVADTPEERVRQAMLAFIEAEFQVGKGRISVEKEIAYHQVTKRFDAVIYDTAGKPLILCECKRPKVPITQETLYQAGRYNAVLQAPHMLFTNGQQWLFFSEQQDGRFMHQPAGWMKV